MESFSTIYAKKLLSFDPSYQFYYLRATAHLMKMQGF